VQRSSIFFIFIIIFVFIFVFFGWTLTFFIFSFSSFFFSFFRSSQLSRPFLRQQNYWQVRNKGSKRIKTTQHTTTTITKQQATATMNACNSNKN